MIPFVSRNRSWMQIILPLCVSSSFLPPFFPFIPASLPLPAWRDVPFTCLPRLSTPVNSLSLPLSEERRKEMSCSARLTHLLPLFLSLLPFCFLHWQIFILGIKCPGCRGERDGFSPIGLAAPGKIEISLFRLPLFLTYAEVWKIYCPNESSNLLHPARKNPKESTNHKG